MLLKGSMMKWGGGEFTVLRLLPFRNVLRYASIYSVSVSFMVSEAKYIDH